MTLFERVFGGNDYNYARTVAAIDEAIAAYGESEPVSFPGTAYSLPCYYGVTGVKITTLGEMKAAMDTIKSKMTRNNRLHDAFESGIASALCAEFLEALKYLHGAEPYAEPEMMTVTCVSLSKLTGMPSVLSASSMRSVSSARSSPVSVVLPWAIAAKNRARLEIDLLPGNCTVPAAVVTGAIVMLSRGQEATVDCIIEPL